MTQPIHRVTAYTLIVLGAIHTTFARCYGEFSTEAVWFTGAGLAFVFLGLFNVAAVSAPVPGVWRLCRIANLIGIAFSGPAAIVVGEPQGYLALLLVVALGVCSFVSRPSPAGNAEPAHLARWATVALFVLFAIITGAQLVGCIIDHHPWFQVGTWAILVPTFAWAAWASAPRSRSNTTSQ